MLQRDKKIRLMLTGLLLLVLMGCLNPVPRERTATVVFQQQDLMISATFNELLVHNFSLRINQEAVIIKSLGNPVVPHHTDRNAQIRYKQVSGQWAGHQVVVDCNQGTLARGQMYPDCQVLVDDALVAELSFR